MHHTVTVWARSTHELAEGARWVDNRLIFTDVLTGRLLHAPGPCPDPCPGTPAPARPPRRRRPRPRPS
ncbi:hypothetical protein KPATCC21470_0216 [Kitasatospora purpeofusca]